MKRLLVALLMLVFFVSMVSCDTNEKKCKFCGIDTVWTYSDGGYVCYTCDQKETNNSVASSSSTSSTAPKDNSVRKGMRKSQVELIWGNPKSIYEYRSYGVDYGRYGYKDTYGNSRTVIYEIIYGDYIVSMVY